MATFQVGPAVHSERHTANDRSRLANPSGEGRRLARNVLVAIQMPCNFFNAASHKRSGLRSPVLASSTICFAIMP